MKKNIISCFASAIFMLVLLLTPKTGDAAMLRPTPEFGARELGVVLDDFMLKSKVNFGKFYTTENEITKNGTTRYLISKGDFASRYSSSPLFTVTTNANTGMITSIIFEYYLTGGLSDSQIESFYSAWVQPVKQRYGNPTEEGRSQFGYPYSNFIENGKYKYKIEAYRITPSGKTTSSSNGIGVFSLHIDAI
jgi:hypothetical protein